MATHTVLVIEDEEDMIWTVQKVMEKVGYKTVSAKSAEDGIKMARELHPDVVLLDIRLPKMDGFEACRILKTEPETSDLKVIFVTGVEEAEIFSKGAEAGADYYVPKPFLPDDLAVDLYYLFDRRFRITMEDRHLLRVARVIPKGLRREPIPAVVKSSAAESSTEKTEVYPDQPVTYDITPSSGSVDASGPSKASEELFEEKMLREMRVFRQTLDIIAKRLNAMEKQLQQSLTSKRVE